MTSQGGVKRRETLIHLVDASVFVFRAWFSIPDRMTDAEGRPVNAVYGFTGFLCSLMERVEGACKT